MNRLRRRDRSGFSKGKQSSIVKYLKEISGYPLSVSNFLSLVELTISGNCRQSNLPVGYTEVEYIESSGTQYINTGICPTNNTKVEVVFNSSMNSKFVYGSRTSVNTENRFAFFFDALNTSNHFQFSLDTEIADISMQLNTDYTVSLSQEGGYLDGELKESYDTQSFVSELPLYLCGINQTGAEERAHEFQGKIYSFKVYENNILIQSLVPCIRDIDGAIGMYDTVSNTFLVNSGTGTFISGSTSTPSPDNPIDIESLGDKTGNLLDVTRISGNQMEVTDNKVYLSGYACTADLSPEDFLSVLGISTGDTITSVLYVDVAHGTNNGAQGRACFIRKDEGKTLYLTYGINGSGRTTYVNTIPEDFNSDTYTNLLLYGAQNPDESGERLAIISNFAIYKGTYAVSALPAYEPYGYKVSGRAEGLNLFDINRYTYANGNSISTSNSTGAPWAGRFIDIDYAIELGKTYTLVCDYLVENASDVSTIRFGYATDRGMVAFTNGIKTVRGKGSIVFSVTVPESINNYNNFSLYINSSMDDTPTIGDKMTISNIMIVKGTYTAETIPPYEPYHAPQTFNIYTPQQLAKVGDVADTVVIDFEKQMAELKKNVCKYTFADNVSFTGPFANGNGEFYRYFFPLTPRMKKGTGMAGLCNALPEYHVWNSGDFEHVHFGQNNEAIYLILNEEYSNDQDVVSHLSKKAKPYFIYPLAEPVTTDITSLQQWDAMPSLWEGSVIITLQGGVEPSNLNLKYYSSVE